MGFFASDIATGKRSGKRLPTDLLERQGCRLCPLDRVKLKSPKMKADGAKEALIYVLGDAPKADDDKTGEPFTGRAGRLLRYYIPSKYVDEVRYNNVINCFPGEDTTKERVVRAPNEVEVSCCRSRIVEDIERAKPKVILGLGQAPLQWVIGEARVHLWRGRRFAVKIGSHTCWYYPLFDPFDIIIRQEQRHWSDDEALFKYDMARVFTDLKTLRPAVVHTEADARKGIKCVTGHEPGALKTVLAFLAKAAKQRICGVDYETNRQRPYATGAKILSASVSLVDECLAFGWDHPGAGWSPEDKKVLHDAWVAFLAASVRRAAHSLGFELEWSGHFFGIDSVRAGPWDDSMTAATVFDERVGDHKNGPLSLGFQTQLHYGLNIKKLSKVDRARLEFEPIEAVLPYNGIDAKYHLLLMLLYEQQMKTKREKEQYEIMLRRVPTVVLTQLKGIPINKAVTEELSAKYEKQLTVATQVFDQYPNVAAFRGKRGEPFNPLATDHVHAIFRDLGIDLGASADEEALRATKHPLADVILRVRKITKRKSTYVDSWRSGGYLWPDDLLHHQLNTLFAETGRSSADNPNIQNVMKRDEEGKEVRRQVEAPPGLLILSADQGQIQARNIAMESRDKVFCKALWEDYDVHTEWAERLAYAYPDRVGGMSAFKSDKNVKKNFRNDVKNQWVFPLFFGAKLESVAGYLHIPPEAISKEFNLFWSTFSGVKDWQEQLKKLYRESGFTESLAGGRRHAPLSPNQIINSPIQNDEAAIVFDGMNILSETGDPWLQANWEIHDDLGFFLPKDRIYEYAEKIVDAMFACSFDWINVPLSVEISIGHNWLDMKETHKFRSDKWNGRPFKAKEYA